MAMIKVKQATNKTPARVINKEEEFNFHPYIHTPTGIGPLVLYEERNQNIPLSQWESGAFGYADGHNNCLGTATLQAGD